MSFEKPQPIMVRYRKKRELVRREGGSMLKNPPAIQEIDTMQKTQV